MCLVQGIVADSFLFLPEDARRHLSAAFVTAVFQPLNQI
jgi:hypothetical protein